MGSDAFITVTVVYASGPRQIDESSITLPEGATVEQAVLASGLSQRHPTLVLSQVDWGVWGRKTAPDRVLRDHDRVEVYRALRVDPKVARRERFVKQGARGAGLFARRRTGGKSGY